MLHLETAQLKKYLPAILIANALVVSLLICFAGSRGYFSTVQELILDNVQGLRSRISPPPPADVAIIGISDQTFREEEFRKPFLLWHKDLAALVGGMQAAGAKVIGLDFLLPDVLFDDYVPGYSKVWLKAILKSKMSGTPVVTGFMDLGSSVIAPHSYFLQALGKNNCGYFNLTTDDDGVIRRQNLWIKNGEGKVIDSFSLAALKAAGIKIENLPHQLRINYRPESHFKIFEFAEITRRIKDNDLEYLRKNFANKIVFVGAMDIRNQDRHPTPLFNFTERKSRKSPGVLIQAQILETMLDDQHFQDLSQLQKWGTIFLLALLASGLVVLAPPKLTFIWAPLLIVGYITASGYAFFNYTVLPAASGSFAIVLSYILSILLKEGVLSAEQRRLKKIFQRYLPASVAESLLEQNDADFFKGDYRRLCILFSDVRSFTTYSENRSPREIVNRLNRYFESMAEIVNNHGGVVDKFIGDGLLAFFGVLDSDTSPSMSGVKAAMEMQQTLIELNREWTNAGEVEFRIGIGLHTGDVMVGNIGSKYKAEFTVIGDAVNLASRLESMTKTVGASILVSEAVQEDIKDLVEVESCGKVKIKGRKEEYVYAVRENMFNTEEK